MKKLLTVCVCIAVLAPVDSLTWEEEHTPTSYTTHNVVFAPTLPVGKCFVCAGGLQVDERDSSKLLIGVCTEYLVYSGGFATLPIANLSETPTRIIGDPALPSPTPGDWDPGVIQQADYLHQHSDKRRVFFVDANSCVRVLDRVANNITTIIGKGNCGNGSLDIIGGLGNNFVTGMAYVETEDRFYISVSNMGLYAYQRTGATYTGVRIIEPRQLTTVSPPIIRELLLHNGYLWHKVQIGVNRYDVSGLNLNGPNLFDNNTLVRFVSSSGASGAVDPDAWYKYRNDSVRIGDGNGGLSLDSSGRTMLIANSHSQLVFLNIETGTNDTGKLMAYCYTSCPVKDIAAAQWVNDYRILAADQKLGIIDIQLTAPTTTTTPTTIATNTTSIVTTNMPKTTVSASTETLSLAASTETKSSCDSCAGGLGGGAIAGIVIGVLVFVGCGCGATYYFCCRKKRSTKRTP